MFNFTSATLRCFHTHLVLFARITRRHRPPPRPPPLPPPLLLRLFCYARGRSVQGRDNDVSTTTTRKSRDHIVILRLKRFMLIYDLKVGPQWLFWWIVSPVVVVVRRNAGSSIFTSALGANFPRIRKCRHAACVMWPRKETIRHFISDKWSVMCNLLSLRITYIVWYILIGSILSYVLQLIDICGKSTLVTLQNNTFGHKMFYYKINNLTVYTSSLQLKRLVC